MKKVYIVGGDGFARVCYFYLLQSKEFEFAGFLGHGGYGHTVDYCELQDFYKGEVSEHTFSEDECAIIGAGYPELRQKIYLELKERNISMPNIFINHDCFINKFVKMGEGNVVLGSFFHGTNIKLGNGNLLCGGVEVGHDVEIGDFNFLGSHVQVLGNVKIGSSNSIGVSSVLLPKCKIGNNNKIAPLSAVYRGCKDNHYLQGNPAQKIDTTNY